MHFKKQERNNCIVWSGDADINSQSCRRSKGITPRSAVTTGYQSDVEGEQRGGDPAGSVCSWVFACENASPLFTHSHTHAVTQAHTGLPPQMTESSRCHLASPTETIKMIASPAPRVSDYEDLGVGLRFCYSNKFPGDDVATHQGTH